MVWRRNGVKNGVRKYECTHGKNCSLRKDYLMKKKEQLEKQIRRLKQIREDLGMNRTEFSLYIGIPLRTLEEWEAGRRKMPDYVLRLITYYTKMECLLKRVVMVVHMLIKTLLLNLHLLSAQFSNYI